MSNIKELREKVGQHAKSMQDIGDKCKEEKRSLNSEEQTRFDQAHSDWKAAAKELETAISLEDVAKRTAEMNEQEARNRGTSTDQNAEEKAAFEVRTFVKWMRNGLVSSPEEIQVLNALEKRARKIEGFEEVEARALSSSTVYTIPTNIVSMLAEALKYYGGVRSVATILPTETGGPLNWPCVDDTSITGALIAESGAVTTSSTDPTFSTVALTAYKWESKMVKIPNEILMDSLIDIAAYILKACGERIARTENTYFTTGTGSSQPKGVVPCAVGTGVSNAAAAALAYSDITNLKYALDRAYRRNASWMFNDQTEKAIIALSIGTNFVQPLWSPSIREGAPDLLLGHKYTINNDMADIGASNISMLFGDFSQYIVRDVPAYTTIKRLVELYAANDQTGFIMFSRSGGNLANSGAAIKKLTHAAS